MSVDTRRIGWRNVTTLAEEIDLTEHWVLHFVRDGELMRQDIAFTRTSNAPVWDEERIEAAKQRIEDRVRAEGGSFE